MPKVSVIIVTYNQGKYIFEALESVFVQTFRDYEVIVVDDGSTDNTKEVLRPYRERIRYFYHRNKGPAAARNLGIRESKGEFIAFLDADDIWLPEKLEKQMMVFEKHREYGLVYTGHENFIGDPKKPKFLVPNKIYPSGWIFKKMVIESYTLLSSVLVKRDVLHQVGFFNENLWLGEDRDLWVRIAHKYKIGVVKGKLVLRRIHKTNISKRNMEDVYCIPRYIRVIKEKFSDEPGIEILIRKAQARILFYRGWEFLLNRREPKIARNLLWRSLKLDWFYPRTFIFYLSSLIPTKILFGVGHFLKQIKERFFYRK